MGKGQQRRKEQRKEYMKYGLTGKHILNVNMNAETGQTILLAKGHVAPTYDGPLHPVLL